VSKLFYSALGKCETWPNLSNISPSSLSYDDVLLVPQSSSISSRRDVDTSVQFGPYKLSKPIISAPMDSITGEKMIRTLGTLGAIGSLPRGNLDERVEICKRFSADEVPCVYAVGLKNAISEARALTEAGAQIILLDVAHGGMEEAKKSAARIKKELGVYVIAGNIVTSSEAESYIEHGVDVARVGVGPGGMCITRLVAGSGFPQLSAVFETTSQPIPVIADGGIKNPGHFAKAIAAGARIVMIGSLFAGCEETPGEIHEGMKVVRGQASREYMEDNKMRTNEFRTAEGVSVTVSARGLVKHVIDDLMGGLRSAMTYAGAKNIEEFQDKAIFVHTSHKVNEESQPWLVKKQ